MPVAQCYMYLVLLYTCMSGACLPLKSVYFVVHFEMPGRALALGLIFFKKKRALKHVQSLIEYFTCK